MSFPADSFASMADHAGWLARHRRELEARQHIEQDTPIARPGSCLPCGRGTSLAAGVCDCDDALDPMSRALLHAAVAEAGLVAWSRLLWLGHDGPVRRRLTALARPALDRDGGADVAVAAPLPAPPGQVLERARRGLADGGCLLAPLTFDPVRRRGDATVLGCDVLGWDVLDAAREAGFSRACVLAPWSRELGYFGALWLLKAVA